MYRSCPTCEASCGLLLEVDRQARQVISIKGDPDNHRSRGYVCAKSQAFRYNYEDPERLTRSLACGRKSAGRKRLLKQRNDSPLSATGLAKTLSRCTTAIPWCSANDLVDDNEMDVPSGTSVLNGVPVVVVAA